MGSGLGSATRALVTVAAVIALTATIATSESFASRESHRADRSIAQAGAFVAADFPEGFTSAAPSVTSHADQIAVVKHVDGCGPYVKIERRLTSTPTADSMQFEDSSRTFRNEVAVFESEKRAAAMISLYEKPSMVGCLENSLEKQLRNSGGNRVGDVVVNLDRQDIAGLGDDSVVYEGTMELTGADGSTSRVEVGNAAVRVGRAVDVVTYSTTGGSLTDVLTPAIDASVSRLRSALAGS